MLSPPPTPEQELKGLKVTLSDLWQNPGQIRKLHSFISAGRDVSRMTRSCAPKINGSVRTCLFTVIYIPRLLTRRFTLLAFVDPPRERGGAESASGLTYDSTTLDLNASEMHSKVHVLPSLTSWEDEVRRLKWNFSPSCVIGAFLQQAFGR